jgi:hypothetical protein
MWRRIPVLPMLFGLFAAWALFGMLMAGDPDRLTGARRGGARRRLESRVLQPLG